MENKLKIVKKIIIELAIVTVCIIMATIIGITFKKLGFQETNTVVIYILFVILAARFTKGYVYGVIASILAMLAFNIFFTKPYFTLSVYEPTYFITFIVMTITSIITSALTSKAQTNAEEAIKKEQETNALYLLTNKLSNSTDMGNIVSLAVEMISNTFECCGALLCFDEKGEPEIEFLQQKNINEQIHRRIYDKTAIKHIVENLNNEFYKGEEFWDFPILGRESMLGLVRIPTVTAIKMTESNRKLLKSMIESIALAMDRLWSIKERIKSREEAIQEHYRGNLLRAISHDLRTPLAGIMGTSEMLLDMLNKNELSYDLVKGIYKDAEWLHSLVENILSLTKLQDGKLSINKQFEAVEEIVGVVLNIIGKRAKEREIKVDIPEEPVLIPVDAKLISQVLVNLLDNSIKHTKKGEEICLSVKKNKEYVEFTVTDRGEGILEEDLSNIFKMFYTTEGKGPDSQLGIGLGLAICKSIVIAHGGEIWGKNRNDGKGAIFAFTLPLKEEICNE